MRIAFTNPPWWEKDPPRRGIRAGSRWPMTIPPEGNYTPFPFFLAYAASYLQSFGYQVMLRDSIARRETYNQWLQALANYRPDLTILETSTTSWEHDKNIILAISYWQLGKVMVVGPPMSTPQARAKAHELPGVISVASGEYERAVLNATQALEDGIDPEPYYPPNLLTQDEILEAPPPLRNWDEIHLYQDAEYLYPSGGRQLQAWSSRGCPFSCSFCVWPQTMTFYKVRRYSGKYLESELYDALAQSELNSVYFDDDTFNLTARHVHTVCKVMSDLNVPWSAMCRIDTLPESTWKYMAASGCKGIKVGIECGSDRVRNDLMNKSLSTEKIRQFLPVLKNCGINVHGTFMFGYPGETKVEMEQTKRFIDECYKLGMTSHQESGAAAHEGTSLYEKGYRKFDGAKVRAEVA